MAITVGLNETNKWKLEGSFSNKKNKAILRGTMLALEIAAVAALIIVGVLAMKGILPGIGSVGAISMTAVGAIYGGVLLSYGLYRGIKGCSQLCASGSSVEYGRDAGDTN